MNQESSNEVTREKDDLKRAADIQKRIRNGRKNYK